MTEPTIDQLARFMCVSSLGPGVTDTEIDVARQLLEAFPWLRAEWLHRHAELQARLHVTA